MWRRSKKRGDAPPAGQRAVERHDSDEELSDAAGRHPRGNLHPDAQSSLPRDWAKSRGSRRSLPRRSMGSDATRRSDVSPTRSVASKASKASHADFQDIYEKDGESEEDVELNPDADHLIDADEADFDKFNLPRPGERSRGRKKKQTGAAGDRASRRLSSSINKLVGSKTGPVDAAAAQAAAANRGRAAPKLSAKDKKKTSLQQRILRTSKRLSFRRGAAGAAGEGSRESLKHAARHAAREAEKQRRAEAKAQAKRDKEEEKRRQREIKNNPWYPAGVDFRYLSPKSKWLPMLGKKNESLDFGDEARLVGVVQ